MDGSSIWHAIRYSKQEEFEIMFLIEVLNFVEAPRGASGFSVGLVALEIVQNGILKHFKTSRGEKKCFLLNYMVFLISMGIDIKEKKDFKVFDMVGVRWVQSDIPSLTRIPRGASRQMGCVGWAVLLCRMPWNVRYKHYKM